MKTYTVAEVQEIIVQTAQDGLYDEDYDGQLILYTGIFVWSDGTYHDEPEPDIL